MNIMAGSCNTNVTSETYGLRNRITVTLIFLLTAFVPQASSFQPFVTQTPYHSRPITLPFSRSGTTHNPLALSATKDESPISFSSPSILRNRKNVALSLGSMIGFFTSVGVALAEDDSVEISDLPPPYVPLLFSLVLVAGVGLLTNSLGDVLSEEASLGDMSGTRAKKEMERSRSSYFKNK